MTAPTDPSWAGLAPGAQTGTARPAATRTSVVGGRTSKSNLSCYT
jgi:hypothetical protein